MNWRGKGGLNKEERKGKISCNSPFSFGIFNTFSGYSIQFWKNPCSFRIFNTVLKYSI